MDFHDPVLKIHHGEAILREGGLKICLQEGQTIQMSPLPGVWMTGTYHYDEDHDEHYWQYDDSHFVGIIDGMKVRL